MKKLLFLLTVLTLFAACKKKYKYVEFIQVQDNYSGQSIREREDFISESSDSAAYMQAFAKFCFDQSGYIHLLKDGTMDMNHKEYPISFKLYNPDGEDITDIDFPSKKEMEERFINDILSDSSDGSKNKVDSAKIKDLLPYFDVNKDEFDPKGKIWYKPKSAPQYVNRNGIYFYFAVEDGKPLALRLKIQYYADDWLFFNKVQFSIDDKAYEYIPNRTETDHGNGKIWEWFDEALTGLDKDLVYALADAQSAKMKFIGRQYHNIKPITKNQIVDMKRTLELYKALGGIY